MGWIRDRIELYGYAKKNSIGTSSIFFGFEIGWQFKNSLWKSNMANRLKFPHQKKSVAN
jgi:hypothetical protein